MLLYILRRLGVALSVALTVSIVAFLLLHLSGDLAMAIAGLAFWVVAQFAAVWAAKRDPDFVEVVRRHLRYPAHLGA